VAEAAFVQSPRATINDNTMRAVGRERERENVGEQNFFFPY
jgi:hypothetical protein